MIEGGYTVWARQSIDSDIFFYKPDKWFKIWFYIVNKVNHKKNKLFERGYGLITYSDIHDKTKATKTQTYKCIRFLKQESMIDAEKTTRGFIIKVLNYDKYQDSKNYKDDKETNRRRLTDDREANTINNNDNNEKMKEIKTYTSDNLTLDQVADKIVEAFNTYLGTKFKTSDGFKPNLEYWLKTYEPKEIASAIKNIKNDKYWGIGGKGEGGMTPTLLFRKKNPQGEPVDYISQLLLVKPKYE